jgi:hypothetical protein
VPVFLRTISFLLDRGKPFRINVIKMKSWKSWCSPVLGPSQNSGSTLECSWRNTVDVYANCSVFELYTDTSMARYHHALLTQTHATTYTPSVLRRVFTIPCYLSLGKSTGMIPRRGQEACLSLHWNAQPSLFCSRLSFLKVSNLCAKLRVGAYMSLLDLVVPLATVYINS